MPPASLYHRENISKVWLEVIDKTESFLRSVITTDGNPTLTSQTGTASSDFSGFSIPRSDRHAALALLLEFSIQKGTKHKKKIKPGFEFSFKFRAGESFLFEATSISLSPVSELFPLSEGMLAGTNIGEPKERRKFLVSLDPEVPYEIPYNFSVTKIQILHNYHI